MIITKKIKAIGINATEHSFRTPLENLLNAITPQTNIKVLQEQPREEGFGAPDFRVEKSSAPIGNIETKPLNENLDKTLKSEQIKRYLSLNPNLVLTNYHEFILIKNKELIERCNLFYLNDLETKKSRLKDESIKAVEQLFKEFFLSEPLKIGDSKELAIHMADRAKIVKDLYLRY